MRCNKAMPLMMEPVYNPQNSTERPNGPSGKECNMRVEDVMTENVKACRPEISLAAAAALLWEGDCGALPVVLDGGKLVGMITDRDIAIALGTRNQNPADIPVG